MAEQRSKQTIVEEFSRFDARHHEQAVVNKGWKLLIEVLLDIRDEMKRSNDEWFKLGKK